MDYKLEIEKIKGELFSLGFTEESYGKLLQLALVEIINIALLDLKQKNEPTLDTLVQNLKEDVSTAEDIKSNVNQIFQAAYGDQAEEIKKKLTFEYLQDTLEKTKSTKDLIQKYQTGDPTAVATINTNKENPDIQNTTSTGGSL